MTEIARDYMAPRKGTAQEQKSLRIPPDLHRRLKQIAVQIDMSLLEISERMVEEFCTAWERTAGLSHRPTVDVDQDQ